MSGGGEDACSRLCAAVYGLGASVARPGTQSVLLVASAGVRPAGSFSFPARAVLSRPLTAAAAAAAAAAFFLHY